MRTLTSEIPILEEFQQGEHLRLSYYGKQKSIALCSSELYLAHFIVNLKPSLLDTARLMNERFKR